MDSYVGAETGPVVGLPSLLLGLLYSYAPGILMCRSRGVIPSSPAKDPKETKCETLVDSCSQQPFFSLFPSPLLPRKHHLETFESRTARALAPFVLLLLVSMLI